jgi:hypothetical protein
MKARALGRPCRPAGLTVVVANPPRPVTAGTYRSPERLPRDHSARETRRMLAKGEAARRRAARPDKHWRSLADVKTDPTPKRDTVRQDRYGAR